MIWLNSCAVNQREETDILSLELDITEEYNADSDYTAISGATLIDCRADVGNFTFSSQGGKVADLNINYRSSGTGSDEVLEHVTTNAYCDSDTFYVRFVDSETGGDIWDWIKENQPKASLSVDADITLPEAVSFYKISTDTGNTDFNSIKGSFLVKTNTGNITGNNIRATSNSEFIADTGNINISLAQAIPMYSSINLRTKTGNAELTLAEDSRFDSGALLETDTGNVTLHTNGIEYTDNTQEGSKSKTIETAAGCKITMSANTGNITVE